MGRGSGPAGERDKGMSPCWGYWEGKMVTIQCARLPLGFPSTETALSGVGGVCSVTGGR